MEKEGYRLHLDSNDSNGCDCGPGGDRKKIQKKSLPIDKKLDNIDESALPFSLKMIPTNYPAPGDLLM
jgi:hypothetical protein